MRLITFIVAVTLCTIYAIANDIKFYILDDKYNILPGATCVIFSLPDSTLQSYAMADDSGFCEMKEPDGDWYLNLSCIAYKQRIISKQQYDKLKNDNSPINIQLAADENMLKELTVNADKGTLTVKDGVISINNIKKLLESRVVTSAHGLLEAVPLISSVDGSNLSLAGVPFGSVIYIDGRPSMLSTQELNEYLKNIPPDRVQGIDIIYNPSPKWKTRSAVINLRLKRQKAYSFNGVTRVAGEWQDAPRSNIGASIFAGLPKLNFNASYNFNSGKRKSKNILFSKHSVDTNITEITDTASGETKTNAHSLNVSAEYFINKSNSATLSYYGQFSPKSNIYDCSANSFYGKYDSEKESSSHFNAVSFVFTNTKGFNVGAEYSHYYANRLQSIYMDNITDASLVGESWQRANRVKAYADIATSLPRMWGVYYGASYEFSRNSNRQANVSNNPNMTDDNVFNITDEHIVDFYAGVQKTLLGNRLSLSASVKGEYYKISDYSNFQILPAIVATFMMNPANIFQAAYQSYKRYPSLWQRQDYRSYTNPYQVSEGNPILKPATYHTATLMYFFKQKYTLSCSYYHVSNFSLTQSYQSPDALVIISKPYNIQYSSSLDLTLVIPFSIGNRYNCDITSYVVLEKYKSSDWNGLAFDKSKVGGAIMVNNSLIVSQKPKITVSLTGMYKLPCLVGLWERGSAWLLNAGVTGSFINNCLDVSVRGFDLLQTMLSTEKMRLGSQWLNTNSNFYSRNLTLEISYRFKGYKDRNMKTVDTSRYGFN